LAQDIVQEAQDLVRLEVQLAQQELKEFAVRNGIAAALLAFGALLVMLAVLVAVPVILVLRAEDHVRAAVIWAMSYAAAGALLGLVGWLLLRLKLPRRTLSSLEETKRWALRQIRSSDR
jgi:hypothetical protein